MLGLDNAGKTCAAKSLVGESLDNVAPTIGFSKVSTKYKGFNVTIYDLGGSKSFRGIWPKYYHEVHGFIFIVDASDAERLEETAEVSYFISLVMAHRVNIRGEIRECLAVNNLPIFQESKRLRLWQYRLWNFQLGDTEKWAKNDIFSNSMLGCHEKAKTLDFKKVCSLSCKKKIEIEIKTCFVNWRYFCQFKKSHMKNVFIKGISIRDQMKISSYSPCLTFTCNTRPIMPWSQ